MMSIVARLHDGVTRRRVGKLTEHFAALIPSGARVLDVGCGDGLLARRITLERPDLNIVGIDVLRRPQTHIEVDLYDGKVIPFESGSFDAVMLVDVLHHTDDPMSLLREAVRVARSNLVVKDHTRDGLWAEQTLRFMDWVGNAHDGVALPYNYWTGAQWRQAFDALGLEVEGWVTDLRLYPAPASFAFGRSLHFVARLGLPARGLIAPCAESLAL
ncbi:MAG TPA: class I SAM-dependent methyltransferase [Isosphaeraceae bacterium]|nr:class I SAM-dependent methyltransferase [Isosphaeraceae bacterium]